MNDEIKERLDNVRLIMERNRAMKEKIESPKKRSKKRRVRNSAPLFPGRLEGKEKESLRMYVSCLIAEPGPALSDARESRRRRRRSGNSPNDRQRSPVNQEIEEVVTPVKRKPVDQKKLSPVETALLKLLSTQKMSPVKAKQQRSETGTPKKESREEEVKERLIDQLNRLRQSPTSPKTRTTLPQKPTKPDQKKMKLAKVLEFHSASDSDDIQAIVATETKENRIEDRKDIDLCSDGSSEEMDDEEDLGDLNHEESWNEIGSDEEGN